MLINVNHSIVLLLQYLYNSNFCVSYYRVILYRLICLRRSSVKLFPISFCYDNTKMHQAQKNFNESTVWPNRIIIQFVLNHKYIILRINKLYIGINLEVNLQNGNLYSQKNYKSNNGNTSASSTRKALIGGTRRTSPFIIFCTYNIIVYILNKQKKVRWYAKIKRLRIAALGNLWDPKMSRFQKVDKKIDKKISAVFKIFICL
ncbi:hypothetical protein AGLY_005592 [Aphis glycines]|uniref:Uncharacterized protein n=1 Tax=Aphis glycines TaxID=307491 RepID=A0A6G0TVJ4_APHGL|nr:hypothetical protein AGLY_005592 [Aphis glycines]